MTNVKSTGSSWRDPDDAPKLTREWAEQADALRGEKLIRRGRPKLEQPKLQVSIRLDPDVLDKLKEAGKGWQARVNDILRKAVEL